MLIAMRFVIGLSVGSASMVVPMYIGELAPLRYRGGLVSLNQLAITSEISAFPTVGAYHASKWALEGLSQSLAQEVAGFGIKVTLVEPGGFSTDWSGSSARRSEEMDVRRPA